LHRYAEVCDGWLIDTNIISATIGSKPLHPGVRHFFESISDDSLRLSVLTVGELRKGIALGGSQLLAHKLEELQALWVDRILPIGLDIVNRWGEMTAQYQRGGNAVPAIDGLLAATASIHNLVVVSHDAFFSRRRQDIMTYDPLSD
jgi:predicted nucleic acid-binding protein